MDQTDYAYALRRDGARMAEAAAGNLDRRVPSCPEWTVGDLLRHTGTVHRFWTAIAAGEISGPQDPRRVQPVEPADEDLVAWFTEGLEHCASTLEKLDPGLPRWSWSDRKDAGFIQRRMAQETAVHCWDALNAVGRDEPVERELAADGVAEFLTHFADGELPAGLPEAGLHLHATDGAGEWTVRAADGALLVTTEHAKAAFAARGTASDLLLLLWERRLPAALETFGDQAAFTSYLAAFGRD
ncbi:maleylpyruvate isomerase family mycothiol-dependent enzyme [Kitasatospora sp. NPDC002227]|uniref:maleylpyruvate isomerase family mycothiol-dependent enzyme n=1 Tax=Kitasatospora sp. NPDC002227 TaxID=3154773 RepID=UPI00332F7A97